MTTSYELEQPWLPASEAIADWDEVFHALLLGDRLRMRAFERGITEAVKPGDVVVDLGTGTGILALWALRAGAARVYGIDFSERVLETATKRLTEAGYGDGFLPVKGMSFDVALPEPADLVISETLGNLVDNEGCVRILADARARFLKPHGSILPSRADSYLVPVTSPRAHASVRDGRFGGPGDRPEPDARFDHYYDAVLPISGNLAVPQILREYEFGTGQAEEYSVFRSFEIVRDGSLTGFKGYFVATLSDNVVLDISGDDIAGGSASDSWKHCYLPIAEPVRVCSGDRVVVRFASSPNEGSALAQRYRWTGRVLRGGGVVSSFDHAS
jgi:protein arginine N-methyltransferase 1